MARKILLADDSVTAQNMGRRILTDAGYEVTTVNNGSAALKKIAESLPELIVLDVYMPGYSGLEVCQRLKETRETARIPVLLTVGKLEPFKPEDARKARADAFIVKPFEASELLTALTKLEDKIVPQPAAGKSGQFAKAWAELEQGSGATPAKSEKFGDSETGWKNRLIIPTPGSKQEEPEPEEAPKASKGKKDKGKDKEELKPMEVVSAVGVPADITPEEVAAIAAAAAAFEEKSQPPPEFAVKKSEIPDEPAAIATASVQPEKVESKPVEVQAKESAPAQEAPVAVAATETPKPVEPVVEAKASEPAPVPNEVPEVAAAEVKAVAADPVPAPAASTSETVVATSAPVEKPAETVAAVETPVPAVATPSVPRWVAQEVPLPPAEVGISLEQEMQKSNAVLQAATAMIDLSAMAISEPPKPAPVEAPAPVAAPPVEAKVEEKIEEVVTLAPAPEPERPQEPAAAASKPEPQPEVVTAVAAAASAGASAPEASKPEAVSQQVSTPVPSEPAPSAPETKANESELAAAWAQWKQIRETVVGSQLTSQIADVAAAELRAAEPGPTMTEDEPTHEKHSGNPTAIASIVDSVLAELKPKLVEEIAKKLGDEKKKKK